jgi:hypothetical protein
MIVGGTTRVRVILSPSKDGHGNEDAHVFARPSFDALRMTRALGMMPR